MSGLSTAIGALVLLLAPLSALAAPSPLAGPLTIGQAGAVARLAVVSPAFKPGGAIPAVHTGYGDNRFPGLSWSAGPRGTRAYAVIVQDADALDEAGGVTTHWIAFNIPAAVQNLAPGADLPAGARQGRTYLERTGYAGPRPPPGPPHRYHFQVFALGRRLDLADGADIAAVQRALRGQVLAAGEIVGTYRYRGAWR